MKETLLDGKINILVNRDKTMITLADVNSNLKVVEIELTPQQLSQALSRLSGTPCKFQFNQSDKIGKMHECKNFEFELPKELQDYHKDYEAIYQAALAQCPDGWEPDKYFRSQDSFFTKNDKQWARCTIRRWV